MFDQLICPICRETFNEFSQTLVSAKGCQCRAKYHYDCLQQVIRFNNLSCPICRKPARQTLIYPSDHYLLKISNGEWNYVSQLAPQWFILLHLIFSLIFCIIFLLPYTIIYLIFHIFNIIKNYEYTRDRTIVERSRSRAFITSDH